MVHIDTILQRVSSRILGRTVSTTDRSKFVWRLPQRTNFPSLFASEKVPQNTRDVSHMLLALEPPDDNHKVWDNNYEAVFIHRPFDLHLRAFRNSYILWSHDDFDNNMTVGYNPALAADLQLLQPLEEVLWTNKRGVERRIGMVGRLDSPHAFGAYRRQVEDIFEGSDASKANSVPHVRKVAVMGAFNPSLLHRMKSEHDVDLYITGQVRPAALEVAKELNIAVIAVGHERCEAYGLRSLASSLTAHWDDSVQSEAMSELEVDILLSSKLTAVRSTHVQTT
ncbi:hypothetical protein ABBQ38_009058 [Trebouxia sp. C0009 RCD-2024]